MPTRNLIAIQEFARTALYSGLRGKAIQATLVLGLLLMGVAYLSATFSPRQPQTVALDVGLSFLRIVAILLGLFWVQELVSKEIDRRTVVMSIAYPVARGTYIVGRYLGILALSLLTLCLLALLLWLLVFLVGRGYDQQFPVSLGLAYWSTVAGIWCDTAVVIAFAMLIASLSTVSALPLALGMAFAIGGRALGAAREYINAGADGQKELVAQMSPILDLIHWLIPDLSRLDWRVWTLYGVSPGSGAMAAALVAALAYVVVMIGLAVRVFSRREFV